MSKVRPAQSATAPADPTEPADMLPHVAVAPELLEHPQPVVVREDDDTDADYQARIRLLAAALSYAKRR